MRLRLAVVFVFLLLSAHAAVAQVLWAPDNSGGRYRGCAMFLNGVHRVTYIRMSWVGCVFLMFMSTSSSEAPAALSEDLSLSPAEMEAAIAKLPLDDEAEFRKQFEAARKEMREAMAETGAAAKELDRVARMKPEKARKHLRDRAGKR